MKDNLKTYQTWAPDNALWTGWAKPVLFASAPRDLNIILQIPPIEWITAVDYHTMVVVDLPGKSSVEEGIALARLGYRPVPLYNGVDAQNTVSAIVSVRDIVKALCRGADELETLQIRPDAPPAFLLDSRRMQGLGKQPGKFDNRWCVFPQDMPSASFLLKHGIQRVIVRGEKIQNDLSHILCRYQEQGMKILLCRSTEEPRDLTVAKPSRFRSVVRRFKVTAGLSRNAAGGFGARIPEPTENSGGRYYGVG